MHAFYSYPADRFFLFATGPLHRENDKIRISKRYAESLSEADKGEKLLEIQTGLRAGMSPPIPWMLDGKQYVTIFGGIGIVNSRNREPGAPPTPPTANTEFPKMLTFVLDGAPYKAPSKAGAN